MKKSTTPSLTAALTAAVQIPLTAIRPSPTNPRKFFDPDKLAELAASVTEHGVLQPVLVRPAGPDRYEVVAGERRYRAAKMAGLTCLPCVVRELADDEVLALQLVENDQREDVRPTEQAAAYKRLADAVGQAEAAKRTGRSEGTIRGWCKLASAPAELAAAMDAGRVSRSVAELVSGIPSEASRERAALQVLTGQHWGDYSVGDLRKLLKKDDGRRDTLSFRETKELLAKQYQVELKQATFSRKALDLVEGAGTCDACPKRAGNDPEAVAAKVRADVCLDPTCFQAKTAAWNKRVLAEAKASGRTVLPAKEADGLFSRYNDHDLHYDAGYVELAATCYEDDKKRKWGALLKNTEADVVVAVDPAGRPRELVKQAEAARIARNVHEIKAKGNVAQSSHDAERKKSVAAARKKHQAGRAAALLAGEQVAEAVRRAVQPGVGVVFTGGVPILQQVAAAVSDFAGADACRLVAKRRGLAADKFGDREAVAKLATALTEPRELLALVAELAAAHKSFNWGHPHFGGRPPASEVAFWKALGVDQATLTKAAAAAPPAKKAGRGRATPAAAADIGDAIMDHLGQEDARQAEAAVPPPPAESKRARKAVAS